MMMTFREASKSSPTWCVLLCETSQRWGEGALGKINMGSPKLRSTLPPGEVFLLAFVQKLNFNHFDNAGKTKNLSHFA